MTGGISRARAWHSTESPETRDYGFAIATLVQRRRRPQAEGRDAVHQARRLGVTPINCLETEGINFTASTLIYT